MGTEILKIKANKSCLKNDELCVEDQIGHLWLRFGHEKELLDTGINKESKSKVG